MLKRNKKQTPRARNYSPPGNDRQRVYSYSSARKTQANQQQKNNNQSNNANLPKFSVLEKFQYALVAILVFAGVGYVFTLDTNAQIRIEGAENFPREKAAYEAAIQQEIGSSMFNRSKLTLNDQKIEESILKNFPEVRSVEVKTSLLRHRPMVEAVIARPVAKLVTPSETYILDRDGVALYAEGQATGVNTKNLISVNDTSGYEIEYGKPALTSRQIGYINEFLGQMKAKKIPVSEMSIEGGGVELHVRFKDKKHFLKLSFFSSARQSSGAYLAVLDKNIPISNYVDLRIPDRAYIK